GVFLFEKVLGSGWSLNMAAVRLPSGGLLLHSPVYAGPESFAQVEALGRPEVLFAPNHFHHLSLPRYVERYPSALAVASSAALPRLRRKGHSTLRPLEESASRLPPGARWLPCAGTRSGEAWLSVPGERGSTLLVADAFFAVTRPVK